MKTIHQTHFLVVLLWKVIKKLNTHILMNFRSFPTFPFLFFLFTVCCFCFIPAVQTIAMRPAFFKLYNIIIALKTFQHNLLHLYHTSRIDIGLLLYFEWFFKRPSKRSEEESHKTKKEKSVRNVLEELKNFFIKKHKKEGNKNKME